MYEAKADVADKTATLNDRLNKTLDSMQYQCERIEAVLSRVNSTPQKIEKAKEESAPRPKLGLGAMVEHLEQVNKRLADLATGVEHIA